jgi:tetratricopeptide (TPR) repeat protein
MLPVIAAILMIMTLLDITLMAERFRADLAAGLRAARGLLRIIVAMFAFYGFLILLNGLLDDTPGNKYPSQIVSLSETNANVAGRFTLPWAIVRWDGAEEGQRVSVTWNERYRLWGGERVRMQVRPGFLAIPWVVMLERDEEHYLKQVLRTIPTATAAWKELLYLYLSQNRLDEGVEVTRQYLRLYPQGYERALHMGMALKQMSRFKDAIPFFEYVVDHHPTYEAYQQLGWTLQQTGEIERATASFKASIPMNPDFWEAYFHLGEVYAGQAKYDEALVMYKKVLEFQPHYPEVESAVMELHKRITALHSIPERSPSTMPAEYCQPWTSAKCRDIHISKS